MTDIIKTFTSGILLLALILGCAKVLDILVVLAG